MNRKLIAVFLAVLVLAAVLGGCSQPKEAQDPEGKKEIKVAFSMDQMTEGNAYWVEGMNIACERFNSEQSEYVASLTTFDAQAKVDKQIADVEAIVTGGYDVLIFSAVDMVGSAPAVKTAHNAGIKVIDVRNMEVDEVDLVLTLQDPVIETNIMKEWILQSLESDPDLVYYAGLIYGAPAHTAQLKRCDFAKELSQEMPERFVVVADGYGNWDTETAMRFTEDWLQAYPEMNLVITANVGMALGASNAIAAVNKTNDIAVTSYDITDDAIARVEAGTLTCSVGLNLRLSGEMMFDMSMKVYLGTYTGDKNYIYPDLVALSKENLSDFK